MTTRKNKPEGPSRDTLHVELDRRSPLPLYAQVARHLKAMISAGEHPAERFYSEGELCEMFSISRATARQAMQNLTTEGWLRRERGHGSFVNPAKFDETFNPRMNLPDQWARVGRPLQIDLKRFELAPCPARFATMLGIEPDAEVLCIERVRADGVIVVSYDYRFIHSDFAYWLERSEAAGNVPLLEALDRRIKLRRGENKIEAALAGVEMAKLLGVSPVDPVLIRETVYYGDDAVPVICGRSLYRADKVRCAFSVDMSIEGGAAPGSPHPSAWHPSGIAEVSETSDWPAIGKQKKEETAP